MISIKNKIPKTNKKVIREMNVTETFIETACDRLGGLGIEDLLKYDVVPTPMQFDDYPLMTKPENSQLICELEDKLKLNDYSYSHKQESVFVIVVMAAVLRLPLSGFTSFSNLLSKLVQVTDVHHRNGRCDYIFDNYNENPLVKDSERLQRSIVTPVILSTVRQLFFQRTYEHSGLKVKIKCCWINSFIPICMKSRCITMNIQPY